jgi:SAM-dependent methyltransferase
MTGDSDKRCDLCDGSQFQTVATRDRRGAPLETVVCTTCGLVSHRRIPSDDELADYYAHRYRHDYHGEHVPSDRRVLRAWNNGQRLFHQLWPHVQPTDCILEVGAGIGANVKAFELAGYDACGVDPGIGFARFAQQRLRANVRCAGLWDLPPTPRYDLVLLVHVIEHFSSPRRSLEGVHRLLRPGGRLYVECPNLAAPFARRAKLFHFAHIHNFTPITLAMMAQRCGFQVERQFGHRDDPNLQFLLTRVDVARLVIEPRSFAETLAALGRYNNLTYHLRWNYLWPRVRKLAAYAAEYVTATRRIRRIAELCGTWPSETALESVAPLRPAATDQTDPARRAA